MSVILDELPAVVRNACVELCDQLAELVGDELVALWTFGAVTFPDRPKRLGDLDTYGVLVSRPDSELAAAIDEIHESIAQTCGVEWDSWYVIVSDARRIEPPPHALRAQLVDEAWALHRAHWLAGRYVMLYGRHPLDFVQRPDWDQLRHGLLGEVRYIENFVHSNRNDAGHAAFAIWNGCRIIYSLETRDVVVSKRAAGEWALDHLPGSWNAGLRAARRVYDGDTRKGDEVVLQTLMPEVVAAARARIDAG